MYQVTIRIKATNPSNPAEKFQTVVKQGIYIPEDHTGVLHSKIKAECEEFMRKNIVKNEYRHLVLEMHTKIEKIHEDFCVLEKNATQNQDDEQD